MNISEFKNGDLITRLDESRNGSNDFQHTKLVFHSVKDEMIHLLSPYGMIALTVEDWSEGWVVYAYKGIVLQVCNSEKLSRIDSKLYLELRKKSKAELIDHYKLELNASIEAELYERASLIRDKIESIQKDINQ